jgi:molybdenum cofactor cytidylyltransferase
VLAIEADGARGRWLKAPAEHEPVVPPWVDVVVPVTGLKAIGEPLDEGVAHRAERLAALLNMRPGERLTPAHLAALVSSTAGGLKGAPESAEIRVLLAGPRMERVEDEIARAVLEASRVRAVVAGDLEAGEGVERVDGRVAGIVLAGGAGARFGGPKQLAAWRGRPLLGYVLEAAVEARLSPLVVVVGAQADAVRQAIEDPHLRVVVNPDWESGQSTSVRAGLAEVEAEVEAAVFLLADMPRVSARTIQRVVEQHRTTLSPIVAPVGGGRRGNPVLFDRAVFSELHTLQGDEGGRSLLERWRWTAVEADPSEFVEVDVPDDLAGLERGP